MYKLRSERIRTHLQVSIAIIVICVLMLAVPWIVKSYHEYQQARYTERELSAIMAMSELSESMLAERIPTNLVNITSAQQQRLYLEQLQQHRQFVDMKIQSTVLALEQAGFHDIAQDLKQQLQPELIKARQAFDRYAALPIVQRDLTRLSADIQQIFKVWDNIHSLLKKTLVESKAYGIDTTNHYAMLLLICDLQDQASRITSYIKAPVTFKQQLTDQQRVKTLQTYNRSEYLWKLIGSVQPSQGRDVEFENRYYHIKTEFLDKSQALIRTTVTQSQAGQPYSYTPQQMTIVAVNGFTAVVDLQRYILDKRLDALKQQQQLTQYTFLISSLMVLICLAAILFAFFYTRHQVFLPLILARNMLLDLIEPEAKHNVNDSVTLMGAIDKMRETLKQRDALAFQLKNLANTDALTGVSNRAALDEYLDLKAHQKNAFLHTALIVLDIDNFKQVNDTYGHLVGDDVIRHIAHKLKSNVRNTDIVVRYGGDEFIVILENCAFGDALYIADQMRCTISHSQIQIEGHDDLTVSVSAGVAVGAESWTGLLAKADQSLLRVKAKGKNAVEG